MGLWSTLTAAFGPAGQPDSAYRAPRAQDAGVLVSTMEELEQAIRDGRFGSGLQTASGVAITPDTAMRVAAVYACVRIISGAVSNMPLHLMRREGERNDRVLSGEYVNLLTRKPCKFMRARQFRRMATAHVLLRGNFYALKVKGLNGHVRQLLPMHPDRVTVDQKPNMDVVYEYTRPTDGKRMTYKQEDILHLYVLTLDGFRGVTPISYARDTIAGSLAMQEHLAAIYKNKARTSGIFTTDKRLGSEGRKNIADSLAEYRSNGELAGRELILEDGLTYEQLALSPQDLQYLETRKLDATDIFMIFGIPPHMAAMVEKSTSWGTGIEEQGKGFVTYTLEDYLTMWEDGLNLDVIDDPTLWVMHDREALTAGNLKDQAEFYATMLQNRVMNPNEVRRKRGMNDYEGGDEFLPTPTMAAEAPGAGNSDEGDDDESDR
jgi:HK97 family phage portal protein